MMIIIDDLHNYFNFDNYHDGWLIDWWQDMSWCQKSAGYIGRQASCFYLSRRRRRKVLSSFHSSVGPSVCLSRCQSVRPKRRYRSNSLMI